MICSAMVEEAIPRWMKEQKVSGGWLTAEYSMLPYSTLDRKARDITKGRLDGRGVEIQRLIGRSLRAVVDLEALGPRTLWIDCDVLQADGGTRTAAITGACVAVALAGKKLVEDALTLEEAGCFSIVLESVPARLAELISKRISIPTIGIGAGAGCDGQVLVTHDLLGLFDRFTPKFVKKYADFHHEMQKAFADYVEDVETKRFPAQEHIVEMDDREWELLLKEVG